MYYSVIMPAADFIFLHGQHVPRCTHDIDKRFADYNTLQYIHVGEVALRIDAEALRLEGPWFWSCYPGPRIAFRTATPGSTWDHRYIAFRGARVTRWLKEGIFPIVPQRPPRGFEASRAFDELLKLALRTDRLGRRRAVHFLEGILLQLAESRAHPDAREPWLDRAIHRLERAVEGADIDYAKLASELNMSETTFRRRFRGAMGTSPHDHLLQHRLARARQLLGGTDLRITAIARQLGYRDVYFFSRQFRKFTGVPPSVYRRSRQG